MDMFLLQNSKGNEGAVLLELLYVLESKIQGWQSSGIFNGLGWLIKYLNSTGFWQVFSEKERTTKKKNFNKLIFVKVHYITYLVTRKNLLDDRHWQESV